MFWTKDVRSLRWLLLASALVVLGACRPPPTAPTIESFSAVPTVIAVGDSSELSWVTLGADQVVLALGDDELETSALSEGSYVFEPDEAGTFEFTLTARNTGGTRTSGLTVTVEDGDLPTISFMADPETVTLGQSSELSWTVTDADSVDITLDGAPVVTDASLVDTYLFTPESIGEFEFVLTATNAAGERTRSVTVHVEPVGLPEVAFAANPPVITLGLTSVLNWTVTGADTTVAISLNDDPILTDAPLVGSHDFTPDEEGEFLFVLTATNEAGSRTAQATVVVSDFAIVNLNAVLITGSRLELTWDSIGATAFDVYSVGEDDATTALATDVTQDQLPLAVPIPASDQQTIRVVARDELSNEDQVEVSLAGFAIVVLDGDYDPYHSLGWPPGGEQPIPGTLRYLIDHSPEGTIVGFASDIAVVNITGVDVIANPNWVEGGGMAANFDSHLVFERDITISGPESGVTIEASSICTACPEDIAFTYRSRAMLVMPDAHLVLENLTVTGGTYISNGAGVRNIGQLTVRNSEITGNRAWDKGGGLFNDVGASMLLIDSRVHGNQAATLGSEVGTSSTIRDVDPITYPDAVFDLPDGGYGGGIYNEAGGVLTIQNTEISDNRSKISGGGIFNFAGGVISMTGGSVVDNDADFEFYNPPASPPAFAYFSYGGGVLTAGTVSMVNVTVEGNDAREEGGGLHVDRTAMVTLTNISVVGNSADFGGAIRLRHCDEPYTNLVTAGVTFSGNVSRIGGGTQIFATPADPVQCPDDPDGGAVASTLDIIGPAQPGLRARER